MKRSEIEEMIRKVVREKKLTTAEKNKKEDIVKGMKKSFKGDKPTMYAIATAKAKKLAEGDNTEEDINQILFSVGSTLDKIDNTIDKGIQQSPEVIDGLQNAYSILVGVLGQLSQERRDTLGPAAGFYSEGINKEEKDPIDVMVAEKKAKDLTGDGKIDSKDYLKARAIAIQKAKAKKNIKEDINQKYSSAVEAFENASDGDVFRITTTNLSSKGHHGGTAGNTASSMEEVVKQGEFFIPTEDLNKSDEYQRDPREQKRKYKPADLDRANKEIILVHIGTKK